MPIPETPVETTTRVLKVIYAAAAKVLVRLWGLLEFFLVLRLLLEYISASPAALVVNYFYQYTDFVIAPFRGILPGIEWPPGYPIDFAVVATMIGYAIGVWLIFQLLWLLERN